MDIRQAVEVAIKNRGQFFGLLALELEMKANPKEEWSVNLSKGAWEFFRTVINNKSPEEQAEEILKGLTLKTKKGEKDVQIKPTKRDQAE